MSDALEKALQTWTALNLPKIQLQLDADAETIRTNQQELVASKKELAAKTKQFKRLPDEDKLAEVRPLLKLYQNEIDNLTKKSKFVENTFFNLYKDFSEAPDPKPLLESLAQALAAKLETDQLRLEVQSLTEQLQRTKDYDQIKAKLIESEQKHATSLSVKMLLKDDEWRAKVADLEKSHKVAQLALERKIALLEKQVCELRALNEILSNKLEVQSQIFKEEEPREDVQQALQLAEMRAKELEKRNAELKSTLEQLEGAKAHESTVAQVEALEAQNAALLQQISTAQRTSRELKEALERTEAARTDAAQRVEAARDELKKYSDYEQLKSELAALRTLEYDVEGSAPLDHALLARNKKLSNDLVGARNRITKLEHELRSAQEQIAAKQAEEARLKAQNERLEADILSVGASDNWDAMSMFSGVSRARSMAPSVRHGKLLPAALIAGFEENTEGLSLLPIITQQRDRFKAKCGELENKLRELNKTLTSLRGKNANLEEKVNGLSTEVKFLQSKVRGRPATTNTNPYGDQMASTTYDVLLEDFESFNYITNSSTLHTLQKWLGSEKTRRLDRKLSSIEQYFYSFLKIVLSNHASRGVFICYWAGVHVFLLYFVIRAVGSFFGGVVPQTSGGGSLASPGDSEVTIEKLANAAAAINAGGSKGSGIKVT